ncbi:MAG TPA: DEAD/DEAH box helicase [Chloroflexota bacterium]|nr:DEAD/DEAH box helicase [Chloroflexota bacterium]
MDSPEPILHAVWRSQRGPGDDPALVVWGEDASEGHRFALPSADIRQALNSNGGGHASRLTLLLPMSGDRPLASTHAEFEGEVELAPLEVSGLALPPGEAVRNLVELQEDGPRLGDDLLFWRMAARFALEFMARERFIPVLGHSGETAVGRWVPLLQGDDRRRFADLAAAMPPACYAVVTAEDFAVSQNDILFEFLAYAVDQLARSWLVERYSGGRSASSTVEGSSAALRSWISSLTAENPRPVANAERIEGAVVEWLEPLFETPDALGFRTCMRLRPPKEGSEEWTLTFLLQSVDDPSILVPAGQVWRERGRQWDAVKERFRRPQEKLLYDLGLAARVFPPVAKGLKNQHPEIVRLTVNEAYAFLKEAAPVLEESDIAVVAPGWWSRRRTGLAWRVRVLPVEGEAVAGFNTPVRFKWQIILGGKPLSPEGFNRLVRMNTPLIRLRNEWIELNPEEAERVQRFWTAQRSNGTATLLQALDLTAQDEVMGLAIERVEFEGWLEGFAAGAAHTADLDPESLHGELRPYQKRGAGWMEFMVGHGFGAVLADDMGLGKTVEMIALLLHRKEIGTLQGPVLLLCPMSVAGNWVHEIRRFGPSLRALLHHGPGRYTGQAFVQAAGMHDVVISTYSLVNRDLEQLKSVQWQGVVLDEAQNVKNPDTQQARAVHQITSGFRVALTGTPIENRLAELWSIMDFLNPDYLGPQASFQHRFAVPIERGGDSAMARQLRRLVAPFILRRLKTDPTVIADLPEKMEMKVYCSMAPKQADLYEATVDEMLRKIDSADGIQRRGLVLATLTRLKQICNHPGHVLGEEQLQAAQSGKLLRLEEMLEEVIAEGDSALVFTQYAEFGRKLQKYLEQRLGVDVLYLHGGTPRYMRQRLIDRFQDPRRGSMIFLLSLRAGGLGLNLTHANHVFHFDRWWNPAVEEQATDRAFRIGQTRDVQVHKFISLGTLEEHIDDMLESKKSLASEIIGTGEGWLTELSTKELRDVLSMRRDLVGVQ